MNHKWFVTYLAWTAMYALLFSSCTNSSGPASLQSIPTAFGNIGQVVVVADDDVWEGAIGDTLQFYYSSAYLILPQPEPIFDLVHFTPEELAKEPTRRELRNYIFVGNMNDEDSPTTRMVREDIGEAAIQEAKETGKRIPKVGKDKWARGQMTIYQCGFSEDEIIQALKDNFDVIVNRIQKSDEDRVDATVYIGGENGSLNSLVRNKLGVKLRIPKDYSLALENDDIIWMRRETEESSSNILMKRLSYVDPQQLTKESVKAIRDSIGRYVSSELEDTYMKINDVDLPMFFEVKSLNKLYAVEARGIWEIENDYMGGPFVSYLVHNPKDNSLIFIDGFLHAPGKDKRNMMMSIEYILQTVEAL